MKIFIQYSFGRGEALASLSHCCAVIGRSTVRRIASTLRIFRASTVSSMCEPAHFKAMEMCGAEIFLRLAQAEMLGKPIEVPKAKQQMLQNGKPTVAISGYITILQGGKSDDLIDFKAAKLMESQNERVISKKLSEPLVFCTKKEGAELLPSGSGGLNVGYCYVSGDSFEDCFKKFRKVCHKFIKNDVLTPWTRTDLDVDQSFQAAEALVDELTSGSIPALENIATDRAATAIRQVLFRSTSCEASLPPEVEGCWGEDLDPRKGDVPPAILFKSRYDAISYLAEKTKS